MRILPFVCAFVALFSGLLPGAVRAADVAVFSPEISNLNTDDAAVLGELVAQAYAAASQRSVLPPRAAEAAHVADASFEAAAKQLGVAEYIRINAVAAGKRVVVTAARYTDAGQLVRQAREVAESSDDLPTTADNLAKTLVSERAPEPTAPPPPAPSAVQPREPLPPPEFRKPKKDDVVYGVKAGVHVPFAKGASYYTALSLQFDGRLQFPRFFLEFGAGFLIPTVVNDGDTDCSFDSLSNTSTCTNPDAKRGHVGGLVTELGASYYLAQTKVLPYLGGGILPRVVLAGIDNGDSRKRDIASMSAYVQFGITFPRDSTTRFAADLRLAQAVLPQHLENDTRVFPTELAFHAGIGW